MRLHPHLPSGLYGITDPTLLPGDRLFSGVEDALKGGCRVIQYRDKQSSAAQQLANAKRLRDMCTEYKAAFIINDSLSLALDSQADGLHLGKTDGSLIDARKALGPDKVIGVTCHSDLQYAQRCAEIGASYCAFGRFFESKTKPGAPPCSISVLEKALTLNVPILAIGGIGIDNIASFSDTPPHNIAVINSLFGQKDIYMAARELTAAFEAIQAN